MNIRIIQLGKTKEEWLNLGIDIYQTRIKPYIKLETLELPDMSLKNYPNTDTVKAKEAELILKNILPDDYVILLDERGIQKSSLDFAAYLSTLYVIKRLVFVIGGVYGTGSHLHTRANLILSFSKMTFTHQHIRLILIEQIYRALMINNNKPYHY